MKQRTDLPKVTHQNIALIKRIEERLESKRTAAERISEFLLRGVGSFYFILFQVMFLVAWIAINTGGIQTVQTFDRPPFPVLGITLSITFFFLSILILVSQGKQIRQAESWAHLDLQLSILLEQGVTQCVRLLTLICKRTNVELSETDAEVAEFVKPTSVAAVADALDQIEVNPKSGGDIKG